MLTRRRFSALLASGAAAAAWRPAYSAPQTVTVASLLAEDKPETRIWFRIRDLVEERLPGRFSFRIVPNAALGGEREVAEGIRLGSISASLSTVSALSSWVPGTQILDLPFLFSDSDHLRRVVEGEVGDELSDRLAAEGFVVGGYINYGSRHLLAKTPIRRPQALDGLRIRAIQSPLHIELWRAYGANPTAIPIPETYNALRTGVVDAMDLTKSAYAGFRLYEVVPYLTETAHIRASGVVYFAAEFWAGLTREVQTVLAEAASEGARYFDELMAVDERASMEQAIAGGAEIIQPENREDWIRPAQRVWAAFADQVGGMRRIESIRAQA